MTPRVAEQVEQQAASPTWLRMALVALLPLILLGALLFALVKLGPADALRGDGYPPIERLTFQRVQLNDQGLVLDVLNDGPDPVTIAQVQVDEAYWSFSAEPTGALRHLARARLVIPYPWVKGETHNIRLVTASGITFDHQIGVAVTTPKPGARFFGIFTLIGLYVGVIPVALGLLWFPVIARLGRSTFEFLLALTLGLLLFLLVDAGFEGIESAEGLPGSFQGTALFAFTALAAYLGIEAFGEWLRGRRRRVIAGADGSRGAGWVLALLIAVGIGLHNFGEGLAIGAAFGLGEAALGGLLILGFALHNTTEGLAIVAPLARDTAEGAGTPRIRELAYLGLIGGVPTILGAWIGGFVYSNVWSVVFLAIGVGAIAQVIVQIVRQTAGNRPLARYLASAPVLSGLMAGFVVMYVTGMLIG